MLGGGLLMASGGGFVPITYNWNGEATVDTSSQTVYTFTGVDIGVADVNRTIVVFSAHGAITPRQVTSITIGGTEAALYQNVSRSLGGAIAVLDVPAGTTADIVVTLDNGAVRCAIGVYSLYDLASSTPVDTGETRTDIYDVAQVTINGKLFSKCIFLASFVNNDGEPTYWTSPMVEDSDIFVQASTHVSTASVKERELSLSVEAQTYLEGSSGTLHAASFQ